MAEEWKQARGYEGWYEVSSLGRVRRVRAAKGTRIGQIIKQTLSTRGRLQVSLSKNGEQHTLPVHVLVAHAFVGPKPDGTEINHIDYDCLNNAASNLEYITRAENMQHAVAHGHTLRTTMRGTDNGNALLTDGDVVAIRASRVSRDKIASMYAVSPVTIKFIRERRSWKHVA